MMKPGVLGEFTMMCFGADSLHVGGEINNHAQIPRVVIISIDKRPQKSLVVISREGCLYSALVGNEWGGASVKFTLHQH